MSRDRDLLRRLADLVELLEVSDGAREHPAWRKSINEAVADSKRLLAEPAEEAETREEWAVFWGCDDPNEAHPYMPDDEYGPNGFVRCMDEATARWFIRNEHPGELCKRTVSTTPWSVVDQTATNVDQTEKEN